MWWIGLFFCVYVLVLTTLLFSIVNIQIIPSYTSSSQKQFSIIVACRNEATHLPSLFSSFEKLRYSIENFEIILVDDHSNDDSVAIVNEFTTQFKNLRLLQLPLGKTGKKAALQWAIAEAKYPNILTTDSDCIVPVNWLEAFSNKLEQTNADVILGGVLLKKSKSFLSLFQYYDMLSLQAVSFGLANLNKPSLCNGANFCYSKSAFMQVNGFEGNEHLASGDDVLLLQKFIKSSLHIDYLIQNIVITYAIENKQSFIQQRKRWFYKTRYTSSKIQVFLGLLFLVINALFVGLASLSLFSSYYAVIFFSCFSVKLSIDFLLTFGMAKKVNAPFFIHEFIIASILYPFAVVFFLGYLTNSNIKWKDRKYPT